LRRDAIASVTLAGVTMKCEAPVEVTTTSAAARASISRVDSAA